jgi:ferredoxin-fold anticodon binding domain-containing protein
MSAEKSKFNYVIGHYWFKDSEEVGVYRMHNRDVHFGTLENAQSDLAYVQNTDKNKKWRIFKVTEL